jgi:dihydrofolate synthase/folylpolyglutamate synthase
MTYEAALAYFASLEPRGWRLGLDRMAAFCEAAGLSPTLGAGPAGPNYIHVAGTNGKGSTTAYLQSLLVECGYRTGAFFSPYVVNPRERWQFGRDFIAPQELADLTEQLMPVAESFSQTEYGGITEFEFKTGIDFAYSKAKKCEWVALEVGLGGRFDATNVIAPRASAIVSIGLDHVNILGHTLAEIAREKAGIIKPGIPVVTGEIVPEALDIIVGIAHDNDAALWRWGVDFRWDDEGTIVTPRGRFSGIQPGIRGAMQGHNIAVAVAAMHSAGIDLTERVVQTGAELAFAPGRFQTVHALGADLILDGAHNEQAARVLAESLEAALDGCPCVLVTNMIRGHEPEAFYRELYGRVSNAHVVPIDFHRAYPPEETCRVLGELGIPAVAHSDLSSGLAAAARDAGNSAAVLVTGSFYLVGEALRILRPA